MSRGCCGRRGGSHGRRGLGQLGLVAIEGNPGPGPHVATQGDEPRAEVAEAARLERECAAIVARMEEVTAAEDNLRRLHAFAMACG